MAGDESGVVTVWHMDVDVLETTYQKSLQAPSSPSSRLGTSTVQSDGGSSLGARSIIHRTSHKG